MADEALGYALVGCGRFGRFCLANYRDMKDIRPVAVADADAALARQTADEVGVVPLGSLEQVLQRSDVDIVHIATPPSTHGAFAIQCMEAGKHVLCEKPLAMSGQEADRVAAVSRRTGKRVTVNFILRHSPIVGMVQRIIRERILGEPLHAYFENYAQDEVLPGSHWFWDQRLSGGIFIEHGVHFFDLYRQWLGPGQVRWATTMTRPGTAQQDRVLCVMAFGDVLVTHYHGFDQPIRLDRQRHLILLERGQIVVGGWIPLELQVEGVVDDRQKDALAAAVPGGVLTAVREFPESEQRFRSHGREHSVTAQVRLEYAVPTPKMDVYGELIRSVMQDFSRSIRTGAGMLVTLEDTVEAVKMGQAAARMAEAGTVEGQAQQ